MTSRVIPMPCVNIRWYISLLIAQAVLKFWALLRHHHIKHRLMQKLNVNAVPYVVPIQIVHVMMANGLQTMVVCGRRDIRVLCGTLTMG